MRHNKGFSLIEVVLVIFVFGIASLGVGVAMQQGLAAVHQPRVMTTAMGLAVGEAERVLSLSFADVVDENQGSPQSYAGDLSSYSREVRVDTIDDVQSNLGTDASMTNYKMVEVRVHHSVIDYLSVKFLKTNYGA